MPIIHNANLPPYPTPLLPLTLCLSAIMSISHPPLLRNHSHQPSYLEGTMTISHHAYQQPCPLPLQPLCISAIISCKSNSKIANVCLSVTKILLSLRFMPISHYLHLPSISHHSYCIWAIIHIGLHRGSYEYWSTSHWSLQSTCTKNCFFRQKIRTIW